MECSYEQEKPVPGTAGLGPGSGHGASGRRRADDGPCPGRPPYHGPYYPHYYPGYYPRYYPPYDPAAPCNNCSKQHHHNNNNNNHDPCHRRTPFVPRSGVRGVLTDSRSCRR